MRTILCVVLFLTSLNVMAAKELSADQLQGLSECDYFKYTECTTAGLNIGQCINKKYNKFAKVCGAVHAENFKYSRDLFKPKIIKKGKISCDQAMDKLCLKNSLSLSQCASKYSKELGSVCGGEEFIKSAKAATGMDECFALQEKICGNEVSPECDAEFQAKAPKKCTGVPVPSDKITKKQNVSSATLMKDCNEAIEKSPCKLDTKSMMKDGVDTNEYLRKYRLCLKKNLTKAKGKCGSHFSGQQAEIDKIKKQKAAGKKWNKPTD